MRILGIDPGYAIVGYGVVDYIGNKFKVIDFGAVETPKEMPFSKRLLYIFHELNDIIDRYRPDFMWRNCFLTPMSKQHSRSAMQEE